MARKSGYRLQTLYEMREQKKKETEDTYAAAQKIVNDEKTKLEKMEKKFEEMKTFREQKRLEYANAIHAGKLSIAEINVNNNHIDRLLHEEEAYLIEIAKQNDVLKKAKKDAFIALQEMFDATKEFKALEKHKEKWEAEQKEIAQQKEEDAIEDISQSQYFSKLKKR